jgi:hypothetical protein
LAWIGIIDDKYFNETSLTLGDEHRLGVLRIFGPKRDGNMLEKVAK